MHNEYHTEIISLSSPDCVFELRLKAINDRILIEETKGNLQQLTPTSARKLANKLIEFAYLATNQQSQSNSDTKMNKEKPEKPMFGTPEELYKIPVDYKNEDNTDIMNCIVERSKAILNMVYWGIEEGNKNPGDLANALWAVDGFLTQAREINNLKNRNMC